MASRLIQSSPEDEHLPDNATSTHPEFELPDVSYLLYGTLEQQGFDLVITNPEGDSVIVSDYFSFSPPPNLIIANGAGLSPEMVRSLMPQSFGNDISFAGPATSGATQIKIGTVSIAYGDVQVKHADGTVEELNRGDTLYKGDVIITGARAFVKAKMLDGTRFHLGKNGEAVLQEFQYNDAAKIGNFTAFVRVGGFHYKSGKIGKLKPNSTDSHSTIKTPSAFVGIRGSELDGTVDIDGKTIIIHRSGYLEITDINGENIVILEFPGNTSVIVFDGGPAFFLKPTEQHTQSLDESLPPADTPEDIAEQEAEDQGDDGEAGEGEGRAEEGEDNTEEASGEEGETVEEDDTGDGDDEGQDEASEDEGTDRDSTDDEGSEDQGSRQSGEEDDVTTPANEGDQTSVEERETSDPNELDPDLRYYDDPLDEVGSNTRGESGTGDEPDLETLDNPDTTLDEQSAIEEEVEEEVAEQEELPPDNEPEAADDVIISSISDPVDIGELILANDTDRDADQTPVLSSVTALNGTGTLEFDPETRQLTYTPDEDVILRLDEGETVLETFSYTVVSGDLTDTATVTVLVVGSNDDPIAEEDIVATREDNILKIEVLENDEDPDPEDTLSISEVESDDILGFVRIEEDGEFLNYFPPQSLAQGDVLTETFSYTVSDGDATTTASVTVTVTGVNNPPVISVDNPVQISSDSGLTEILLSDIFADADLGSNLTILEVDQSLTKGTIIIGSIFYDPGTAFDFLKEGETGRDSFFIKVQDEFGATGSGTYIVEVPGVNDNPIAQDDNYRMDENTSIRVNSEFGVLENDFDPEGDPLVLDTNPIDGPVNGSLILNEDGSFTYTPNAGFSGIDSFAYFVSDPQGLVSRGSVSFDVVKDIPVIVEPVPNTPPSGEVFVIGSPVEGEVVNADATRLDDADGIGQLFYQWLSGGVAIPGATGSGYLISASDVSNRLAVEVSYSDNNGFVERVLSAPTIAVITSASINNPGFGTVTIDNLLPSEGDNLTVNSSISDLDGVGLITYDWETSNDAGATWVLRSTGPMLTTNFSDVGSMLRVVTRMDWAILSS
jgi:VCBS repeat-containing protein